MGRQLEKRPRHGHQALMDIGRHLEKSKSQTNFRKSQSTMPLLASSKSHVSLISNGKISGEPKDESSSRPSTGGLLPTLQSSPAGLPASPSQTGSSLHEKSLHRKTLPAVSHMHLR